MSKTILITGGAGYIGSHTNKYLLEHGYDTVIIDNLVYGHRENVTGGKFIQGDIADSALLDRIFTENDISAVVHFAAYAYVGESVCNPAKYYRNNVANTINLLDAMLRNKVKTIVFSSSCATYGVPDHMPITEDMEQKPINPYGATKLMIERIFADYHTAYGLRYMALRYFNAAGADPDGCIGEQHVPETHIIPLILEAAAGKRTLTIFGTDYPTPDGTCIRDYIHVNDLADAHLRALEYLECGGESTCCNLGTQHGVSILELINATEKITGQKIPYVINQRRPGDPPVLIGSGSKAEAILGWKPKYSDIEIILKHAWNWYCKLNEGL